jgi:hypothetical protein
LWRVALCVPGKRTLSPWKRGHDHVVEALGAVLDMSGMPFTTKQAQILRHLDSAKCSDILVQCKLAHFEDLVLDFSLTHPRTGFSTLHLVGSWKPDALANLTQSKNRKHAIPYEQADHAFL